MVVNSPNGCGHFKVLVEGHGCYCDHCKAVYEGFSVVRAIPSSWQVLALAVFPFCYNQSSACLTVVELAEGDCPVS